MDFDSRARAAARRAHPNHTVAADADVLDNGNDQAWVDTRTPHGLGRWVLVTVPPITPTTPTKRS